MRIINTLADIALLEKYKILPPDYLVLIKWTRGDGTIVLKKSHS